MPKAINEPNLKKQFLMLNKKRKSEKMNQYKFTGSFKIEVENILNTNIDKNKKQSLLKNNCESLGEINKNSLKELNLNYGEENQIKGQLNIFDN